MFIEELGVRVGEVIEGKYRIEAVLGSGGMAIVVAARHVELDDRVAIKFLRREFLKNPELIARFRREARAAVKIKGEHAARVSDVGQLSNGTPFMVMEYLHGADLAQWLQRSKRLAVDQAVEFMLQTAEALAEAHALGIVHRDLKPANLFVTRRPDRTLCVKVLDFGISKRAPGFASSDVTHVSAMMGSPLYMSPEQLESAHHVDARSDLWSLGVILYELLTGRPPFVGDSMPALVRQITAATPAAPRTLRPEIPAALEAVVLKCLEKERDTRYASVAAFADALSMFAPERKRTPGQRVSAIMAAGQLRRAHAESAPNASKPRPALRFWPHATTVSSRRALRYGMGTAAVLAAAAFLWVRYESVSPVDAPPAASAESEPAAAQPAPTSTETSLLPAAEPAAAGQAQTAVPADPPAARVMAKSARPDPRSRSARSSASSMPSTALDPAPVTIPAPREAEPVIRERDASVGNAMGDDLRSLKKPAARRTLDLGDPFR